MREREAREERRIKTALKLSGLSLAKTLEDYDFAFQRGVDKNHIDLLATCEFARRKENILFLGPPGVGKSHLAQAIGIKAIQNGFSVTFVNADNLIEKMRRDEANPNRRLHRRKFMSAAVLIIDELGFQALDRKDAHLLFKVISYRYERSSTIITSNKMHQPVAGDARRRRSARHRHPRPPTPSQSRSLDRRQELQTPRTGGPGDQPMTPQPCGKVDVPQPRETRCPLTGDPARAAGARAGRQRQRVRQQGIGPLGF